MADIVFSSQMESLIGRLRRSIGDIGEDPICTDVDLYHYISDAVSILEGGLFKKGIYVDDGDFMSNKRSVTVPFGDQLVYLIKAQILFTEAMVHSSSRDSLSYTKSKLSIDTSSQPSSHRETLKMLDEKLRDAIYMADGGFDIEGVRVE